MLHGDAQRSSAPPMNTGSIRSGLCSVTFRDLDIGAVVDLVADAGLGAIEWGADRHVRPGDTHAAERARRACDVAGIACPTYGSYLFPHSPDADIDAVIDSATRLGSGLIRIWTPFDVLPDDPPEDRREAARGLERIAGRLGDAGLDAGLEFHGGTLTHTARSTLSLLADVGAPNLLTYWQPTYWDHEVCNDRDAQLAELDLVLPHLAHLHLYWWEGTDRRPLRDAEWLLPDALSVAATDDGKRVAFLEFVRNDDPESFRRDASTLTEWIERL